MKRAVPWQVKIWSSERTHPQMLGDALFAGTGMQQHLDHEFEQEAERVSIHFFGQKGRVPRVALRKAIAEEAEFHDHISLGSPGRIRSRPLAAGFSIRILSCRIPFKGDPALWVCLIPAKDVRVAHGEIEGNKLVLECGCHEGDEAIASLMIESEIELIRRQIEAQSEIVASHNRSLLARARCYVDDHWDHFSALRPELLKEARLLGGITALIRRAIEAGVTPWDLLSAWGEGRGVWFGDGEVLFANPLARPLRPGLPPLPVRAKTPMVGMPTTRPKLMRPIPKPAGRVFKIGRRKGKPRSKKTS
jgi:hypothetical protein